MDNEKIFLLALTGLLALISWLMIKPFLSYVLFALILGFVLYPLQRKISPYTGPRISAFALMFLSIFIAVVPLILAGNAVIKDAQDIPRDLQTSEVINTTKIENYINEFTGIQIDIERTANSMVKEFTNVTFGSFSRVFNLVTNITIGLTLMMFLLYYFLRDGKEMSKWVKEVIPLENEIKESLYERINITTWAVIKGHVFVAVSQGIVAGIGLFITGVPNYIFWTFIMVLLGFIPFIGSIIVWGPAAIYLFMINRPAAGFFLLLYGTLVVGFTDNVIRPLVVDRQAELHPAAVLIGVLGGVYIFGAAGIFFGPIILGVFKSVLLVFKNKKIAD